MESASLWTSIVPGQPALSVMVWLVIIIVTMYISREPAHEMIHILTHNMRKALKIMAYSVSMAEKKLKDRNREVLLAQGRDEIELRIEREFQGVEALINRDLSGYPTLQRDLNEQITRINEDYVQSGDIPPQPPEWVKAVATIAKIPSDGSPVVSKILNDIHSSLKKSSDQSVDEYRKANKERHLILKKMMPYWRSLKSTLESVEKKISGLESRSNVIDGHMKKYEGIRAKTDVAERLLSSSSLTQFFTSGLVLLIASIGMYVNFQLVALPMSEMVGAGSYVGSVKASDIAALFIIAIEVILGLFLMESLGVTRLFPIIHTLDDKKRKAIIYATFGFLVIFAGIESSLAYMRDLLAANREALTQVLAGTNVEEPEFRWIPAVGQMVMGFILPFVLTFVAIPLETFIHSSRTVFGIVLTWFLRTTSLTIRLIGNILVGLGNFLITLYDLIIFLPLRIELLVKNNMSSESIYKKRQVE